MLTSLTPLLSAARASGGGLGAMNVIQIEHAEAIVAGAEQARRPVVLQISENTVTYHRGLEPIARACLAIAKAADVPVCVHLDHAVSLALVDEALDLGIPSVMYDASHLPYADNVASTADLARRCRTVGVSLEAELGEVGGKDGVHAPGVRTDPGEAASFVAETGVDALAVAVGSSHAMTTRDAHLDEDLIVRMAEAVPVPLVLHGSSGVSDAGIVAAIAAGITKINIATHLNKVMTAAIREALAASGSVDPRKYLGPGRDAVTAEVARLLVLFAPEPSVLGALTPTTSAPHSPG